VAHHGYGIHNSSLTENGRRQVQNNGRLFHLCVVVFFPAAGGTNQRGNADTGRRKTMEQNDQNPNTKTIGRVTRDTQRGDASPSPDDVRVCLSMLAPPAFGSLERGSCGQCVPFGPFGLGRWCVFCVWLALLYF
jgi:hypothetical protein